MVHEEEEERVLESGPHLPGGAGEDVQAVLPGRWELAGPSLDCPVVIIFSKFVA